MKKLVICCLFLFAVSAALALDFGVGTTYGTKYMFRGQRLLDNPYLAPTVVVGNKNFELQATSFYDVKKKENFRADYDLAFVADHPKFDLKFGFKYYDFVKADTNTSEFYVSAGWKTVLHPYVTVFFDASKGNGQYILAGIEKSLVDKDTLSFGVNVGYLMDNKMIAKDYVGFYNGEIYLTGKINVGQHIIAKPILAYNFPLNGSAKVSIEQLSMRNAANTLYGGMELIINF